jgi:hypothetical protein
MTRASHQLMMGICILELLLLPASGLPAGQASSFWTKTAEVIRLKKEGRLHAAPLPAKEIVPLLALKWWIIKVENGREAEVPSDTAFTSGDTIKLAFTPNQDGYLYIINKQAGKGGQIIFPRGDKGPDENKATRDRIFYAPACRKRSMIGGLKTLPTADSCYYRFTQETGDETLMFILSREPIIDLAQSLAGGSGTISAEIIERLKASSGQKLQTITSQKSALLHGAQDRFATYVMNTNVSDNEELIDYIVLKHEK